MSTRFDLSLSDIFDIKFLVRPDLEADFLLEILHDSQHLFVIKGMTYDLDGHRHSLGSLVGVVHSLSVLVVEGVLKLLLVLLDLGDGHDTTWKTEKVPNGSVLYEVRLHLLNVVDLWGNAGPHGADQSCQFSI